MWGYVGTYSKVISEKEKKSNDLLPGSVTLSQVALVVAEPGRDAVCLFRR